MILEMVSGAQQPGLCRARRTRALLVLLLGVQLAGCSTVNNWAGVCPGAAFERNASRYVMGGVRCSAEFFGDVVGDDEKWPLAVLGFPAFVVDFAIALAVDFASLAITGTIWLTEF